jgi:hypothetical protein
MKESGVGYLRIRENRLFKLFLVAILETKVVEDVCLIRMEGFTCDCCL